MKVTPRVLILGGTTEARGLALRLVGDSGAVAVSSEAAGVSSDVDVVSSLASDARSKVGDASSKVGDVSWNVDVVSSLAGRVASPGMPAGQVRIGGFGGAEGLASWIEAHGIRAVIDATHPFAATISWNAATAAAASHVPLLALRRAAWLPGAGDQWLEAASLRGAALMLPELGRRHFLTIGRQGVSSFVEVPDAWFLVRCIDPPQEPTPPRMELVLDRGPFSLDAEIALLRSRRVDTLITKNSGGESTAAKLEGARKLALPVVMVQRPATPPDILEVADVQSAVEWVHTQIG